MADYFDPSDPSDVELLHSSVREDPELPVIVDQIEWEVIDRYTEGTGDHMRVQLEGYPDSDDLSEALRRTIADVASWVLRDYSNEQGVVSQRQGNRSVVYSTRIPSWRDYPPQWDRRLTRFDKRRVIYGI